MNRLACLRVSASVMMPSRKRIAHKLSNYAFVLPAAIFLLAFVAYPMLYNLVISFRNIDVYTFRTRWGFAGFANYVQVTKSPVFRISLYNTFYFTAVCCFFQFSIGFALALFFSKRFWGNQFPRGFLLICWLLPPLVTATIWSWIFAGNLGIVNFFLTRLRIIREPILWLADINNALNALIITNTWVGVPFNMLLLAAGLTTIPEDIYEAALMDGASTIQRFLRITLPLLRPTILSVLTLGLIYTFKVFDLVYIMTGGGPINATELLSTLSYRLTFVNFEFSKGAATANVLFVILLIIGIVYSRFVAGDETSV